MTRGVISAMVGLVVWASPAAAQTPAKSVGSQIRIATASRKTGRISHLRAAAKTPRAGRLSRLPVAAQAAEAADDQDRSLRSRQRLLQQRRGHDLLRIHRLDPPDRAEGDAVERDLARGRRGRPVRGRAAARGVARDVRYPEDFRCSAARRTPPTSSRRSSCCNSARTWRAGRSSGRRCCSARWRPTSSRARPTMAAVHGLPAQRFVNVLCIAYGAQAALFADYVKQGFLPPHRRRLLPLGVPADRACVPDADRLRTSIRCCRRR